MPLARLCQYYLDCLSHEDLGGVSIPAGPHNGVLEYAELEATPFATGASALRSPTVRAFRHGLEQDMNRKTLLLGYPVRLKQNHGAHGMNGLKLEPLFLFSFQEQYSAQGNMTLAVDIPQLNFEALKSLINPQETALLQEGACLAEKLGIGDSTGEQPGLEEMFALLREIRPGWDWGENIEPAALSIGVRLPEMTQQGIYNRCILIATERSPFTQGLETELKQLQVVPEIRYGATALGRWLNPQAVAAQPVAVAQNPLVEVVPLNAEQREAVHQALANPLTVISGPPGTGKSQVVIALLANAALQGKTVLFASKINKAVDVVEARVNRQGQRPILLRVGPNHPHALGEYLVALLGAAALGEDQERFRECEARNTELQKRVAAVGIVLQSVIDLWKEVDRLEQQVEQTRNLLGEQGFALLRKLDWEALEGHVATLRSAIRRANKVEQNPVLKSIWPLVSKGRFRRVAEAGTPLRVELGQLGCPLPIEIPESSSIDKWIRLAALLTDRMPQMLEALQYFQKLDELNQSESMDVLARKSRNLMAESSVCAEELWRVWLRLQPSRMTAAQRTWINNITAQLALMMGGNNPPAPGQAVFRQMLQQIPALVPCWAVTSLAARNRIPFEPGIFDLLVIDEASQCDIASALPLLFRAKQVVILGDQKQLPHISRVTEQQDQQLLANHGLLEERVGWSYSVTSLFKLAGSLCGPSNTVMLRDHHRSHAQIIEFSNKRFYDESLRLATRYDRLRIPYPGQPAIRWVDVQGTTTFAPGVEGGAVNEAEAQAVVVEVERLIQDGYEGSIGVVTPFRAQVNRIRQVVSQRAGLTQGLGTADFLCEAVHGFQGDERDVMIFSPAVSDTMPRGARWFVDASRDRVNLFNVAVTRARATLIVVGNRNAMRNCQSEHLREFVRYTESLEATQLENNPVPPTVGYDYPAVPNEDRVSKWERYFYPHLCRRLEPLGIWPIPQYRVENCSLDACDFALFVGNRKLDIEIDGEFYHRNWDGELCRRDQIRTQMLIDLGWDVMRFWVYQVRDDLDRCLARIEKWAQLIASKERLRQNMNAYLSLPPESRASALQPSRAHHERPDLLPGMVEPQENEPIVQQEPPTVTAQTQSNGLESAIAARSATVTFEHEATELSERRWPALSEEQQEATLREFKRWMEEGGCQPKMEPSLLGLDWSLFVTRKFPEYADQISFRNPPEFVSYGFSALDAYATAMLAAHFSFRSLGVLNFTCSLKRSGPESQMYLEFVTIPEQGRINPDPVMLEMLNSFPRLLQTKRIEAGAVFFLEGEGCGMRFAYPGQMVAKASPFLRDRPDDLWPQVTLSLTPTDELRIRAQDILAFLLSPDPVEGNPN